MVTEQTYFEDVEVGTQLPSFQRTVTIQQLVRYAGASRDFAPIHYDQELGRRTPWGTVILHGMMKSGFLAKLAGDLAGAAGVVRYLKFYYRQPDVPGDTLTISGSVIKKYVDGRDRLVDCELFLTNGKGEVTTNGTAIVTLPSRQESRRPKWLSLPDDISIPLAGEWEGEKDYLNTDKIHKTLDAPWKPWVADVSASWIELFARSVDDMNPLYVDQKWAASDGPYGSVIASPTFLAALDPWYRMFEGPKSHPIVFKEGQRGGGNGWDEFEWYSPIRPGDTMTAYSKWLEPYEKKGRSGILLFTPREAIYENQRKEIVARSRGAVIQVV